MNDGERLLQAILHNPGDFRLRQVWADWLEENGQHLRAESVRKDERIVFGQPERVLGWWYADGGSVASDLLLALRLDAEATLIPAHAESKILFRGGLLDAVRCTVADWLACGKGICDRHPVRTLVLHDFAPWMNPAGGFFMVRVLNGRNMQDCRDHMDAYWIPDRWGRRLMSGTRLYRNCALRDRRYPTETEARLDVEAAALAWAKERRGRKGFPGRAA